MHSFDAIYRFIRGGLGQNLIRGDDLAALSFIVAAGDRRVEAGAFVLAQIITVVHDGQIDLCSLRSVVGLVQLEPPPGAGQAALLTRGV